ncbi:MAG: hypothetical protein P4L31_03010 [Candidatus Babeliales bacterium]|nr:hypothetical protein [Candidatus Babeliales bacterium]
MKNTLKAMLVLSVLGGTATQMSGSLDSAGSLQAMETASKADQRGRGKIEASDLKGLSASSKKSLEICTPEKFQKGHRNLNYYKETVQCAAAELLLDKDIELTDIAFIIKQLNNLAAAIKAYQPAKK